ncbi:hypothetical protein U1Q18_052118 [Sarracenia purpurea var. burkii]
MARSADALFGQERSCRDLSLSRQTERGRDVDWTLGVGKSTIAREVVRRLGKPTQALHGFPDVSDSLVEAYVEFLRAHSPDETLLWIESAEHFSANARAQLGDWFGSTRECRSSKTAFFALRGGSPDRRSDLSFNGSPPMPRDIHRCCCGWGAPARYTSLENLMKSGGSSASNTYEEEIRRSVDALPIDLQDAFRVSLSFSRPIPPRRFPASFPEHEACLETLIDQGLVSIAPQSSPPLLFIIEPREERFCISAPDPYSIPWRRRGSPRYSIRRITRSGEKRVPN